MPSIPISLRMQPDPTFYPSPRDAMRAPPEDLAYVAGLYVGTGIDRPDFLAVVDVNPNSPTYGKVVGRVDMPYVGDELHHFGWNACSSAFCPYAKPYVERRYLVVPGLRSSRIYIIDTKPDPKNPQIVKTIDPGEVLSRSGYSRLHTVHCGPEAIYISALGGVDGDGPGGILMLDHYSFDVLGRWEIFRGPQYYAYDFWWHLAHDIMITSEWTTPKYFENGLDVKALVEGRYGNKIHFWDLRKRKHIAAVELSPEDRMVLELRPFHNPTELKGFVNTVVNLKDLSSAIWLWFYEDNKLQVEKVIEIDAQPLEESLLPDILKPFKAVPPLVTDIDLSLDDKYLYLSLWGLGELRRYDVSDPFKPRLVATAKLGGIYHRARHPNGRELSGGPQMVEISRDGRRVYVTNSLYSSWDNQFYPEGIRGWLVKLNADPDGSLTIDRDFFVDFGEARVHQVRLKGGDASSDSYCYP
ncbi:MAG: selenium-binding protein [Desulfurococcaceae archaeon]|nr:MAG: selenium-binding protein [Desulfurococcaceae archaeon]